jgi:hypothetical protein
MAGWCWTAQGPRRRDRRTSRRRRGAARDPHHQHRHRRRARDALRGWLSRLGTCNAQGEYYLTDIFAMAADGGDPRSLALVADPVEVEGANDAHATGGARARLAAARARAG